MTDNAIRVQLPGGAMYAPAMTEAASKIGSRSGLQRKTTKALTGLVDASVALLNSGDATTILLQMQVHEDSIQVKVVGKGCTSPAKTSVKALASLAAKKASSYDLVATTSAHTITFTV